VQVLLRFAKARGARKVQLLKYRNSGDVTGDKDRVVGYAAMAFSKGGGGKRTRARRSARMNNGSCWDWPAAPCSRRFQKVGSSRRSNPSPRACGKSGASS